eukprot:CAMPEP_0184296672 /NCGR_PEP_ID=MMETSP1049-20130417/7641_1 /TAXON_ID=77928 /ORGANISM="Proteomonas sulcata, Strain CCMP704" /LENGTH=197 /DNA_ID=CAMNT_0026606035 /DNA_START=178 /DNA_END=768 /DNA_ORIENTATION=+
MADPKVSAVAAGILSNLALYGNGEVKGEMLQAGVMEALESLLDKPERTGLSAAKAAAYLCGEEAEAEHPLIIACHAALDRLCNALKHTLEGKELYGVTFDVFELVLAIKYICVRPENKIKLEAEGGITLLLKVVEDRWEMEPEASQVAAEGLSVIFEELSDPKPFLQYLKEVERVCSLNLSLRSSKKLLEFIKSLKP